MKHKNICSAIHLFCKVSLCAKKKLPHEIWKKITLHPTHIHTTPQQKHTSCNTSLWPWRVHSLRSAWIRRPSAQEHAWNRARSRCASRLWGFLAFWGWRIIAVTFREELRWQLKPTHFECRRYIFTKVHISVCHACKWGLTTYWDDPPSGVGWLSTLV